MLSTRMQTFVGKIYDWCWSISPSPLAESSMEHSIIKHHLQKALSPQFSDDEIHAFGFWVIPHCESLSEEVALEELHDICEKLKRHIPIQYIFEAAFFGPLTLKVTPATLIPRPETEELCHLILQKKLVMEQSNGQHLNGLDIGTGSGCIPMYLLHHCKEWNFTAVDISEDALDIAAENAFHTGVETRIQLQCSDVLTWTNLPNNIDLLVSNPPYVKWDEAPDMDERVLQHEPHLALFTPENDPLIFYKKLAQLCQTSQTHRSTPLYLWLEINQYLATETLACFAPFASAEVVQDLSSNPRFIYAVILPKG